MWCSLFISSSASVWIYFVQIDHPLVSILPGISDHEAVACQDINCI